METTQTLPREMPGAKMFFGHIPHFLKGPRDYFVDCSKLHGPVFRVKTPRGYVTIVCGRICADLLDQEEGNGLTRKGLFKAFRTEVGVDIFELQGKEHDDARKLTLLTYSRHVAAQFVPEIQQSVTTDFAYLRPGEEIELKNFAARVTLHAMMATVSPIEMRDLTDRFFSYGDTVMHVITQRLPAIALLSPFYRKRKLAVHDRIDEIIERHAAGDFTARERVYLVDAAIRALGGAEDPKARNAIRGLCIYALAGSVIYTARLVFFLWFEILKNGALREKLLNEIDAAFGDGPIDSALFRRMPGLRSAYMETLRMFPLLPGLPFKATREVAIAGCTIPAGEDIVFVPQSEHFEDANYTDPYRFDPERFHVNKENRFPKNSYFPYGISKRHCSAAGSTEVIVMTIICSLLQRRSWKLVAASQTYQLKLNPLIGPDRPIRVRHAGPREVGHGPGGETVLSESFDFVSPYDAKPTAVVLPESDSVSFNQGDILIREGDAPDAFYMLTEGAVDVERDGQHLVTLHEGDTFGEVSLLKNIPRTATVRVASPTARFIRLMKDEFLKLILGLDIEGKELPKVLARQFLSVSVKRALPGIDSHRLTDLVKNRQFRHFDQDAVIIRQGDRAENCYVIIAGEANVLVKFDEALVQVATLKPGDMFGETGIISGMPRNATVKAANDLTVLEIHRDTLLTMLKESKKVSDDLYSLVFRRLNQTLEGKSS